MSTETNVIFAIIAGIVGLSLFHDGWMIVWHKKEILYLSLRIELWLTKLFQGERVTEQLKKKKTSPRAMRSYAIESLILGAVLFVISIILIFDSWLTLRVQ